MAGRERKTWIIYPEYFNKSLSRSKGRRVPRSIAVNSPSPDEISEILDDLKIPNRVETQASYPSTWYRRNGRIIMPRQEWSKHKFLKRVGNKLKKKRQEQ